MALRTSAMAVDPVRMDPPPQVYFVGSAIFHYLGPAFAVLLFARVEVLGVAWLRIAAAAVVFVAWRRPWRGLRVRGGRGGLVARGGRPAGAKSSVFPAVDPGPRRPPPAGAVLPGVRARAPR